MGIKVAVASGNWSNPATWDGGLLPQIDDIVASNGYTITIDQNITVVQLTNLAKAQGGIVPNMTGYTTPSGIASASQEYSSPTYAAWKAFDGSVYDSTNNWLTANTAFTPPQWIQYEFPTPKLIAGYAVRGYSFGNIPTAWQFQAWDGSSWVVLDTVSGVSSINPGVVRTFSITTSYSRYRLYITAGSNPSSFVAVGELNILAEGYIQSAVQGGGFIIGSNVSIVTTTTGNGFDAADIANGLIYSANSPSISSFSGKIPGLGNNHALQVTGTGTLNIVSNLFTSAALSGVANVLITNNSTVNITGDVAYFGGNTGLYVTSATTSAQVTITGNVYIGNMIWGSQKSVVFAGGGTLNVIGTINTNVSTSGNGNYPILLNAPSGKTITLNHTGSMTSTSGVIQSVPACVYAESSLGYIFIKADQLVGGDTPLIVQSSFYSYIFFKKLIYGTYGQCPLRGIKRIFLTTQQSNIITYRNNTTNGALAPASPAPQFSYLSPGAVGGLPNVEDVRYGITFGYGTAVGTARIPNPNQVTYGVAVDNTFGNAVLTAASIWDYLVSSITVENSIGMRLKNVSTPQTIGEQLEAFLRLD